MSESVPAWIDASETSGTSAGQIPLYSIASRGPMPISRDKPYSVDDLISEPLTVTSLSPNGICYLRFPQQCGCYCWTRRFARLASFRDLSQLNNSSAFDHPFDQPGRPKNWLRFVAFWPVSPASSGLAAEFPKGVESSSSGAGRPQSCGPGASKAWPSLPGLPLPYRHPNHWLPRRCRCFRW